MSWLNKMAIKKEWTPSWYSEEPRQSVVNLIDQSSRAYKKSSIFWIDFMNELGRMWMQYKWTEELDNSLGDAMDKENWKLFKQILSTLVPREQKQQT
jgi:hypothetical protein